MKTCEITTKVCERTLVFQQVKVFLKVFENAQPQVYDLFHSGRAWHWWEKKCPSEKFVPPVFFSPIAWSSHFEDRYWNKRKIATVDQTALAGRVLLHHHQHLPGALQLFSSFLLTMHCWLCSQIFPDNVVLIAGHLMPPAHILKADSELNEMRPKNIYNFPIM